MKIATVIHGARNLAFAVLAVSFTFALFSPVLAADRYVRTTVTVKLAGFDLKKPADVAELYRQIRRGADKACLGYPGNRNLAELLDYQRCREEAIVDAVRSVGDGNLTAFHEAARRNDRNVG
jgi:UrcA family protein